MAHITQETRGHILHSLQGIQSAVLTARNSTKIPPNYQNFELVLSTLAGCLHSVERGHDEDQIIDMLRKVSNTLGLWQAGLTETVVRSARLAINEMIAELRARKPIV